LSASGAKLASKLLRASCRHRRASSAGSAAKVCVEVGLQVAAEVGRVVAVDRGAQPGLEQRRQVVLRHRVEDAQLHVRQRAHRQRRALAASRCTSAGLSTQRTPWSMRSTFSTSSALSM
jgi:hypothetical protein